MLYEAQDIIVRRLSRELREADTVALSVGIPQLVLPLLPSGAAAAPLSGNGNSQAIDISVTEALEVSTAGDLIGPNEISAEALNAPLWIVATMHTRPDGTPKLVRDCSSPSGVAARAGLVITELGVIEISDVGLVLKEVAPGVATDDVKMKTNASLHIADDICLMEL